MKPTGRPRAWVIACTIAVLAFGAALVVACGDDDDGSAGTTTTQPGGGEKLMFDPARANDIAQAAMLVESDLPGTGWSVLGTDQFNDDEFGEDSNSAACKKINDQVAASSDASDVARAGRAQKEFERKGTLFEINVESQVNIFKDANTPEDALEDFKAALESDDFEQCFKDLIAEGADALPGVKIEAKTVDALVSPPNGGAARALEVTIKALAVTATVHLEYHIWREGNAGITVSFNGPKDDVTAGLVRQVLQKTKEKLDAQATK